MVELAAAGEAVGDERAFDVAIAEVHGGVGGEDAAEDADAGDVEDVRFVEVVEDAALVGAGDVDAEVVEVDRASRNVDDDGGTGNGVDRDAVGGGEVVGVDREGIQLGVGAGEDEIAVVEGVGAVGAVSGEGIGKRSEAVFRGGEVEEVTLGKASVEHVESAERGAAPDDGVALEDLAVGEAEVAVDHEGVGGGGRQFIADTVVGEAGVSADGGAAFHIGVRKGDVSENEVVVVGGGSQVLGGGAGGESDEGGDEGQGRKQPVRESAVLIHGGTFGG